MRLKPGNIWSGSKTLAVFTSPTEIAFLKGNLKNHYPIEVRGKKYKDAEVAYQSVKKSHDVILSDAELEAIMTEVLTAKLAQYPLLYYAIADSGGVEWLEKCSHHVNGGSWEGDGRNSRFINCLIQAFERTRLRLKLG